MMGSSYITPKREVSILSIISFPSVSPTRLPIRETIGVLQLSELLERIRPTPSSSGAGADDQKAALLPGDIKT